MTDFRYEVHDEDGCLRKFRTRHEAIQFLIKRPDLKLTIQSRKPVNTFRQLLNQLGEALL